jgi:hypothetical protein
MTARGSRYAPQLQMLKPTQQSGLMAPVAFVLKLNTPALVGRVVFEQLLSICGASDTHASPVVFEERLYVKTTGAPITNDVRNRLASVLLVLKCRLFQVIKSPRIEGFEIDAIPFTHPSQIFPILQVRYCSGVMTPALAFATVV